MKSAKYNFRKQENKEQAVYKLVLYPMEGTGIKGSYINGRGNRVVVFYGYYKKSDYGLQMLRSLVQKYKSKFYLARIYAKQNLNPNNDQFNEIIETYKF